MSLKLRNDQLGRISVEEFKEKVNRRIVLMLDNVRSQHNIGSAFRTADAFGIGKIYLSGITSTPPSAEIHKSALGAEFSVGWEYYQDNVELIKLLKDDGAMIVCIEQTEDAISLETLERELDHEKSSLNDKLNSYSKVVLIFGNEVKGVDQRVVDMSDLSIEIPQYGTKHSLNVSVAIGVILWSLHKRV